MITALNMNHETGPLSLADQELPTFLQCLSSPYSKRGLYDTIQCLLFLSTEFTLFLTGLVWHNPMFTFLEH